MNIFCELDRYMISLYLFLPHSGDFNVFQGSLITLSV